MMIVFGRFYNLRGMGSVFAASIREVGGHDEGVGHVGEGGRDMGD
jgi:hypothetical protein